MPSTATTRNRLEKQATGENTNTWGSKLNSTAFDLIDSALDGRASFTLSGAKTLSSTNYAADEARMRFLDITGGTGGTITIPAVEKWYIVRNNSSGAVVFTTGGATTANIPAGQTQFVVCDGSKVFADTIVTTAQGYAADAAASAASVSATNLVHLAGSESISGSKTFSTAIIANAGITINAQTLTGLTATGKAIAEATNPAGARAAIGMVIGLDVQGYSSNLASLAGLNYSANALKIVRVNSGGSALELVTADTVSVIASNTSVTAGLGSPVFTGAGVSFTLGKTYSLTMRGLYSSSSTATGLALYLTGTGTVQASGRARIWHSATAFTDFPISVDSMTFAGNFVGANVAAAGTKYPYEIIASVSGAGPAASASFAIYNTNATGTVTLYAGASSIAEAHD